LTLFHNIPVPEEEEEEKAPIFYGHVNLYVISQLRNGRTERERWEMGKMVLLVLTTNLNLIKLINFILHTLELDI
jgi:hypothetical protein